MLLVGGGRFGQELLGVWVTVLVTDWGRVFTIRSLYFVLVLCRCVHMTGYVRWYGYLTLDYEQFPILKWIQNEIKLFHNVWIMVYIIRKEGAGGSWYNGCVGGTLKAVSLIHWYYGVLLTYCDNYILWSYFYVLVVVSVHTYVTYNIDYKPIFNFLSYWLYNSFETHYFLYCDGKSKVVVWSM